MNLQENINRIQQMMGIITEDKRDSLLNMIDKWGMHQTSKLMGGYNNVRRMLGDGELSKNDEIQFVRNIVEEWMDASRKPGLDVTEFVDSPIDCGSDNNYIRQIQTIHKDGAFVDTYLNTPLGMLEKTLMVPYEDLPEDSFKKIFDVAITFINKYMML